MTRTIRIAAGIPGESIGRHGSPGLIKFHSDFWNYPVAVVSRNILRRPDTISTVPGLLPKHNASPWNSLYRARFRCDPAAPFLIALPPQSVFFPFSLSPSRSLSLPVCLSFSLFNALAREKLNDARTRLPKGFLRGVTRPGALNRLENGSQIAAT